MVANNTEDGVSQTLFVHKYSYICRVPLLLKTEQSVHMQHTDNFTTEKKIVITLGLSKNYFGRIGYFFFKGNISFLTKQYLLLCFTLMMRTSVDTSNITCNLNLVLVLQFYLLEDLLVDSDSSSLCQFKQHGVFRTENFFLLYRIFLHVTGDHQRGGIRGGRSRWLWCLGHDWMPERTYIYWN